MIAGQYEVNKLCSPYNVGVFKQPTVTLRKKIWYTLHIKVWY